MSIPPKLQPHGECTDKPQSVSREEEDELRQRDTTMGAQNCRGNPKEEAGLRVWTRPPPRAAAPVPARSLPCTKMLPAELCHGGRAFPRRLQTAPALTQGDSWLR